MTLTRRDNKDEAVHAAEDRTKNKLLKLNQNKTELIVFSTKQSVNKIGNFCLKDKQANAICKCYS